MDVTCYAYFDLVDSEHFAIAPEANRDEVLVWLREVPNTAQIRVDWNTRSKLVAVWKEER